MKLTKPTELIYDDNSIQTLNILDHARLRVSTYVTDTGSDGIFHAIKEIIDNSLDELENISHRNDLLIAISINLDIKKGEIVFIIKDNGRGIPLNSLRAAICESMTSGKFDQNSYSASAGLLGIGMSSTSGLSKNARYFSIRDKIKEVSLYYENEKFSISENLSSNKNKASGLIAIIKLDSSIFDIKNFIRNKDYSLFFDWISKLRLFIDNKYSITLTVCENPDLVRNIKTMPLDEILNSIPKKIICSLPKEFNKGIFIKNYFGIDINTNSLRLIKTNDKLLTDITLIPSIKPKLYEKILSNDNKITFVNNILLNDIKSYHLKLIIDTLKKRMVSFITKHLREYFLNVYKLPIFYLINIRFQGAQFGSTLKNTFKDKAFLAPYQHILDSISDKEIMKLFTYIKDHINIQYNKFSNKSLELKTQKRILTELSRPSKYYDCVIKDPNKSELILTEGDSATSLENRDKDYQAFYSLRGKVKNSISNINNKEKSIESLKKNDVYKDIIKLMGIIPGSDNITNRNFGKILIITDADSHGLHISSLLLGNLGLLFPRLLKEGKIKIIDSPLFLLHNKKKTLYARTEAELNYVLSDTIYSKAFSIKVDNVVISGNDFNAFIQTISEIAGVINNIITETQLSFESLKIIINIIDLLKGKINVKAISKQIGIDVYFDKKDKILILPVGLVDYIIPIEGFLQTIERHLSKAQLLLFNISIKIKYHNNNNYEDINIIDLIILINELKSKGKFKLTRAKGLGRLSTEDFFNTCLNDKSRYYTQINGLGNEEKVFKFLGSDSRYRKTLVEK